MNLHILITLLLMATASVYTAQVFNLNKGVIVQLFEWKWLDIAKECEDFLAPKGYAGVQISPPNENIIIKSPEMRPWWERYQPVSYRLKTRSGTEEELQEMINRCNRRGVRIFADAVLNHMTGPNGTRGTAGTTADYDKFSYPGVEYTESDFHRPPCEVNDYRDEHNVRFCQLLGKRDLDQSKKYVKEKQVAYLNKLISMGVAGFRIDAAKHMWPSDLKMIFDKLDNLSTKHGFQPGTRPLIYLEVVDYGTGEAITWNEYRHLGLVADVRYNRELGETFAAQRPLEWLRDYATTPGKIPSDESIVYIDDHNTQRFGKKNELFNPILIPYKMAIAFMLAYPWGTPRILSAYYFQSIEAGPPHDDEYNTISPHPIENNVCQKLWSCEHRWRQISNMVHFHNVVAGTEVTNFQSDGDKQAAFCRGNKGFIAFNTNRESEMKKEFQTCLPKGKYCDVISGNLIDNKCTGKTIEVKEDGIALIEIPEFNITHSSARERDNVLAIHVEAQIGTQCSDNSCTSDNRLSEDSSASIETPPKPQHSTFNKGVIVHLFEWKWLDIAKECEEFLAPNGFDGVQISPPNENIIVSSPVMRPWWERYQPVSYILNTRSGTEEELQEMLDRCNKKGVKIFADVVLNHMTGAAGNKGTAGSSANYGAFQYPIFSFNDFHTPACDITNYYNAYQVRFCQLLGMRDLDQSKDYVRDKQVEYLNKLISMGVAGFRIDAAKHMWPSDLKAIIDRLDDLSTKHGFQPGTKALIYHEVPDYGDEEPIRWYEYKHLGLVTDFTYSGALGDSFLGKKSLDWLKDFAKQPGKIPSDESVVFIDNHDTERTGKSNELTNRSFRPYKMAIAFMLAYPWGTPQIMSGYYFQSKEDGPPHDDNYNILSPHPIENNICKNKWSCEHRWRQIYNMVRFRKVVAGTGVTNFQSVGFKQVGFCRGNKGFIAFNTDPKSAMKKEFQTCLPKGKYCDVITGNLIDNKCTGKTIDVREDGKALIELPEFIIFHQDVERDNVVAIHEMAKVMG